MVAQQRDDFGQLLSVVRALLDLSDSAWLSTYTAVCRSCSRPTMTRRGILKLLLTSAGIKNASIHDALLDLLGKPIAECTALCIPTACWGHPLTGPGGA